MDIEKLKILSKKASEAGELVRAVTAFKNELKDKEHMHDVTMSDHFKTLREPLIEQQKKTDEKQDKVIEQLQKNQLALTSGLQDIMTRQLEYAPIPQPNSPNQKFCLATRNGADPARTSWQPDAEKFWDENLYPKLIEINKHEKCKRTI